MSDSSSCLPPPRCLLFFDRYLAGRSRRCFFVILLSVALFASVLRGAEVAVAQSDCKDTDIWCADLTAASRTGTTPGYTIVGYEAGNNLGSLTPATFTYGGVTYTVNALSLASDGTLYFVPAPPPGETAFDDLTLNIGDKWPVRLRGKWQNSEYRFQAVGEGYWDSNTDFEGEHVVHLTGPPEFPVETLPAKTSDQGVPITPFKIPEASGGYGTLAYSSNDYMQGVVFNPETREYSGTPTDQTLTRTS